LGDRESKEGATLMIEIIKTYFETLEGLSTEELDRSAEKLVRAEKRNVFKGSRIPSSTWPRSWSRLWTSRSTRKT
jgi:hypothetical protein